jgi:hypothetical protein
MNSINKLEEKSKMLQTAPQRRRPKKFTEVTGSIVLDRQVRRIAEEMGQVQADAPPWCRSAACRKHFEKICSSGTATVAITKGLLFRCG